MKKIRSYLLFTSIPFRIGVMILFPLLLYGITYLFEEPVLGNIVKISFFAVVEVFFDFWVFGGICSKDFNGMEYMKSSIKGRQILKSALIVDAVRKFLWLAAVVFATYFIFVGNGSIRIQEINYFYVVSTIMFGDSFVILGSMIGRYVSFYPIVMLISGVAGTTVCVFCILPVVFPIPMFILSFLCCAVCNWLNIWNVMRKVEKSYYDTQN